MLSPLRLRCSSQNLKDKVTDTEIFADLVSLFKDDLPSDAVAKIKKLAKFIGRSYGASGKDE